MASQSVPKRDPGGPSPDTRLPRSGYCDAGTDPYHDHAVNMEDTVHSTFEQTLPKPLSVWSRYFPEIDGADHEAYDLLDLDEGRDVRLTLARLRRMVENLEAGNDCSQDHAKLPEKWQKRLPLPSLVESRPVTRAINEVVRAGKDVYKEEIVRLARENGLPSPDIDEETAQPCQITVPGSHETGNTIATEVFHWAVWRPEHLAKGAYIVESPDTQAMSSLGFHLGINPSLFIYYLMNKTFTRCRPVLPESYHYCWPYSVIETAQSGTRHWSPHLEGLEARHIPLSRSWICPVTCSTYLVLIPPWAPKPNSRPMSEHNQSEDKDHAINTGMEQYQSMARRNSAAGLMDEAGNDWLPDLTETQQGREFARAFTHLANDSFNIALLRSITLARPKTSLEASWLPCKNKLMYALLILENLKLRYIDLAHKARAMDYKLADQSSAEALAYIKGLRRELSTLRSNIADAFGDPQISPWRQYYNKFAQEQRRKMSHRQSNQGSTSVRPNNPTRFFEFSRFSLEDDLEDLDQRTAQLMPAFNEQLQLLIGTISIEDTALNKKQAQRATALTLLAAIYLPLTLATGVFGMNIKEIDEGLRFWWVLIVLAMLATPSAVYIVSCLTTREQWRYLLGRPGAWCALIKNFRCRGLFKSLCRGARRRQSRKRSIERLD